MRIASRCLGVDFSEGRIHFVVTRRIFKRTAVVDTGTLDLSGAASEADVGERMADFLRQTKLRSRRVVAGIPLRDTMLRVLDLPPVEEKHLRQMIGFELERHLPLPVDEIHYDHRVLRRSPAGVRVLVAAVERGILARYRNMLLTAGLPTTALTASILADAEVAGGEAGGEDVTAIYRQGSSGIEIAILRGAEPIGIYRFELPAEEDEEDEAASAAHIARAVRHACLTATGTGRADRVFLAGPNGHDRDGLAQTLELDTVEPLAPNSGVEERQGTAHRLASLGMDDVDRMPNFLPQEQRSGDTGGATAAVVGLGVFAALATSLLLAGQVIHERRTLAMLEDEIDSLSAEVEEARSMQARLREQDALIESFMAAGSGDMSPLSVLTDISRYVKKSIWITEFRMEKGQVDVGGRATNNEDVDQLKIFLDTRDMFRNVETRSNTIRRGDYWKFKLGAELDPDEGADKS